MSEQEEFEFRLRYEKEQATEAPKRKSPIEMKEPGMVEAMQSRVGGLTDALTATNPIYQVGKRALGGLSKVNEALDKFAYEGGGKVAELGQKAGLPSDVSGVLGVGTNLSLQALPMVFGGEATLPLKSGLKDLGRWLMMSAMKPTAKERLTGQGQRAADYMMKHGLSPNLPTVEKMQMSLEELGKQFKSTIAPSKTEVKLSDVESVFSNAKQHFKDFFYPEEDLKTLDKTWSNFVSHPEVKGRTDIPIQTAQRAKQGLYEQLYGKYGEFKATQVEEAGLKAIARGLKESIAKLEPKLDVLNKQESELINALTITERTAWANVAKNPANIAYLAHSKTGFAAYMADKSATFKALVARFLDSHAADLAKLPGQLGGGAYGATQGNARP